VVALCGTDMHIVAHTINVCILGQTSQRQTKKMKRNRVQMAQNVEIWDVSPACSLEQLGPSLRAWTVSWPIVFLQKLVRSAGPSWRCLHCGRSHGTPNIDTFHVVAWSYAMLAYSLINNDFTRSGIDILKEEPQCKARRVEARQNHKRQAQDKYRYWPKEYFRPLQIRKRAVPQNVHVVVIAARSNVQKA
jgi:hypothetical protein